MEGWTLKWTTKMPKKVTHLDLCRELLELRAKYADPIDRMDAIKSELKLLSRTDGKFRETIAGLGYVSVSPEAPERVVGEQPVIDVANWQGLKEARREKLLADGLVSIQPIIKGAYYGRVEVKLHA